MSDEHEHKNAMQSGHVARALGKARAVGRLGRSQSFSRDRPPEENESQPVEKQDRNDGYR